MSHWKTEKLSKIKGLRSIDCGLISGKNISFIQEEKNSFALFAFLICEVVSGSNIIHNQFPQF